MTFAGFICGDDHWEVQYFEVALLIRFSLLSNFSRFEVSLVLRIVLMKIFLRGTSELSQILDR